MNVGWIGVGAMGAPMATILAASGHRVVGFDQDPSRAKSLVEAGIIPAASVREAATGADIVVVMVATPEQVESLLFGEGKLAAELKPGTVLVIMATVGPGAMEGWADALESRGVGLVDAPVSGGTSRAATGDLLIMVGGLSETIDRAQPLLDALGGTVVVTGNRAGDGQRLKIVNQLLCGVHIAVAGEALALAESLGMNPRLAWDALRKGAATSFMFDDRGARMVDHDSVDVKSALDIFVKDMGLVVEAADQSHSRAPLATAAEQAFLDGHRAGYGMLDDSSIINVFRKPLGA